MNLNVYKDFPYSRRYYLTHPWKWIRHCLDNISSGFSRAKKGYCFSDIADFDQWLLTILPAMLKEIADKDISFPGQEPFETAEKWSQWLKSLAEDFAALQDDWAETKNEYEEPYHELMRQWRIETIDENGMKTTRFVGTNDQKTQELKKLWMERSLSLQRQQQLATDKAFTKLAQHLYKIWI